MISFVAFFIMWAERMGWDVPDCHYRACHWLEHRGDLAVLRCFRGFGKSTILAVYNAWRYYQDRQYRILHQSESDPTAYKTSRDTQNVIRNHPLTRGMLPDGQGTVEQWWVNGSLDMRNGSMYAKGILSNVTSARADECQNDDVEVPRNIQTPEAREKLRYRLGEQTHILVPGGRKLYIGTPHTHDSLYDEVEAMGADCLTIKFFEKEHRIDEKQATARSYALPFRPEYVFVGIHIGARLLAEGVDYQLTATGITFAEPPGTTVDCYAECAWPERFTPAEMEKRRQETRTVNEWDSQYQLHSKPIGESRLDPERIREYNVQPEIRYANRTASMWLGSQQIVGAVAWWDVATGKAKADASAFSLVLTDSRGHLYWHVCQELIGDLAEFDERDKITGGQVVQIRELVIRCQIPQVVVEVNGPGSFAGKLLRQALKGTGCGVREEFTITNKQKRILDAFEAPLSSRFLWAHSDVLDGPAYDQMRDFNPAITNQPDDFIDSGAGAISETPVRIGKLVGKPTAQGREDWQPTDGDHEVAVDY
ncbi:TPA: phage terminase large subunit [Serratia marcescens]|uniref:phage terminase large subunit n=1 Tax=Serratia TaxID=613 RepID=UPI001A2AB3F8|nr:phage terminase large subunit [Serratia nevei]HAU4401969.1 phage terminase large subunit [Serratia marcescens]MDK5934919.1 phage terminase large subunit [Serratia nevei]MEC5547220.1 phage terminase large subunit [Serratia nevei]MEC5626706.1 phage terminase large subunit [Serratia nevei]MEC5685109.1 phage terminase large subunit [Serratia nevei]